MQFDPEIPEMSALDFFPDELDYESLRTAATNCRGCLLYKDATQTVFGEGAVSSELMFVGEQPGDEEDVNGRAFVGPAGMLLDRALQDAGIDRSKAYVTNVVKHFKWTPQSRGKRRLHQKPNAAEIAACEPWLAAELEIVSPRILVLLGATAAQAILGKEFRVTKMRRQWLNTEMADKVMATVHPSSILRAFDSAQRSQQYREFVSDLSLVAEELSRI